ncbi:hypothetical protein P872_01380 [Rhodonellum psychrophilum GCM71 = DSM 17998]|uniref:Uncharacterized protein n=1 Tax=Rhodonellum psychrophilum GCM71 = DSM 17998 TaxID=1123057 RepID=U5BTK4_9BACT|nr:hypothetical protein P872_01380 [Rhodonellum psychrophilum GCM71 = DSM 17998]
MDIVNVFLGLTQVIKIKKANGSIGFFDFEF